MFSLLSDPNVFVADSGSSSHTTGHNLGMQDTEIYKGGFLQPGGGENKASMRGTLPVVHCTKDGNELGKYRINVKYVKNQRFNLMSETRLALDGWETFGNSASRWATKGAAKIIFDIKIDVGDDGCVFAGYFKRNVGPAAALASVERLTVLQAHRRLGHCNEETTRKVAKNLGWNLVPGGLDVCEACTMAKAKQKNVVKASEHVTSKDVNGRVHLDLATIKSKTGFPKPTRSNWVIMVDERTQLKFSSFHETKNGMVEPACVKFDQWRQDGKAVKYVRLDNAGENKLLQQRATSEAWKLNIKFEFTARDTPQQNHLAELSFASIANKGRALMIDANVPLAIRYRLFREAFQTATLLDGLVPIELDGITKSRYAHWSGEGDPKFAKVLRTWGEAGTVKLKNLQTGKLDDRGTPCMFIGYALDYAEDVYRMWDPHTGGVHETLDIIWLRRMYYTNQVTAGEDFVVEVPAAIFDADVESTEVGESTGVVAGESTSTSSVADATTTVPDDVEVKTTRSGRQVKTPARFQIADASSLLFILGVLRQNNGLGY